MIRPMLASAAAAVLALSLAASPVEARPRGGAVVAGAVVGLAAAAIIGSALADRHQRDDRYIVTGPRHRYQRYHRGHGGPHDCGPGAFCRPHSGGESVGQPAYGYPPGYTVYD